MVLLGDFLEAKVFFDRHRVVGATLDRRVIGDERHLFAVHRAYARDDARRWRLFVVHAVGRQWRQFQKRRAGIEKSFDPFARQELAPTTVPPDGLRAAAGGGPREALTEIANQRQVMRAISSELIS